MVPYGSSFNVELSKVAGRSSKIWESKILKPKISKSNFLTPDFLAWTDVWWRGEGEVERWRREGSALNAEGGGHRTREAVVGVAQRRGNTRGTSLRVLGQK